MNTIILLQKPLLTTKDNSYSSFDELNVFIVYDFKTGEIKNRIKLKKYSSIFVLTISLIAIKIKLL